MRIGYSAILRSAAMLSLVGLCIGTAASRSAISLAHVVLPTRVPPSAMPPHVDYRPRPASSYLHGPFVAVRIALGLTRLEQGRVVSVVTHTTVFDRSAIRRLVGAINSVHSVRTYYNPCPGGGTGQGPAWLAFVHAHHALIHAFEPSPCQGLTVNNASWIDDPGERAWGQIITLARGRDYYSPARLLGSSIGPRARTPTILRRYPVMIHSSRP